MNAVECPREQEVVSMVVARRWPEGCDEELMAHVASCEICGEVAAVASVLREDYEETRRDVRVPAAGQVWWRAAVRARLEAAHAAARPITWLHGLTVASAVGVTLTVLGIVWPSVQEVFGLVSNRLSQLDPNGAEILTLLTDTLQRTLPFAIGIAACLVLAPIALYFALSDD